MTNVPGIQFINNIFIYDNEFIWLDHGFGEEEFLGNIYWNINEKNEFMNYPSFESWASDTNHEIAEGRIFGVYADPMVYNVNAPLPSTPANINKETLMPFYLLPGSPVVDQAIDLAEYIDNISNRDLVGTGFGKEQKRDLGALELP